MLIPNRFYESLDGLRGHEVKVVCFGVQRSASTRMFQIMCELFPDGGVIKTHSYLEVDAPVVITIRDFRDCAVSSAQVFRGFRFEANRNQVPSADDPVSRDAPITMEEAIQAVGRTKEDLVALDAWEEKVVANEVRGGVYRYENSEKWKKWLSENTDMWWGMTGEIDRIFDRYGYSDNLRLRRFTDQQSSEDVEPEDRHCGDGAIGKWRNCGEQVRSYLCRAFERELAEYGYE